MQRLRPRWQERQATLERFGESVEETPDSARLEIGVPRLAPFVEYVDDGRAGQGASVDGVDNQIVNCPLIGHSRCLVSVDAPGLYVAQIGEPGNGALGKAGALERSGLKAVASSIASRRRAS